ncbi:MAG: hypothetical protein WCO79_02980 [bacterium]
MKTSTKEQLNQLLAQLLVTADNRKMSHDQMQMAIKDTAGLAERFHAFIDGYEVQTTTPSSIPLAAHKARAMSELFRDGNGVKYYYRDGDLDDWFTANSPECLAGTARFVETPKVMTFKHMAQWVTGLQSESFADLSRAIVAQNLYLTPEQWNDQIVATQKGEDILLTNGYASFAFARTGKKLKDEKGGEYDEVVMFDADRSDDGRWHAYVHGLGFDGGWDADFGLLLRNSP